MSSLEVYSILSYMINTKTHTNEKLSEQLQNKILKS